MWKTYCCKICFDWTKKIFSWFPDRHNIESIKKKKNIHGYKFDYPTNQISIIPEPEKFKIVLNLKIENCEQIKHYHLHEILVYYSMRNDALDDYSVPISTVWVPGLRFLARLTKVRIIWLPTVNLGTDCKHF